MLPLNTFTNWKLHTTITVAQLKTQTLYLPQTFSCGKRDSSITNGAVELQVLHNCQNPPLVTIKVANCMLHARPLHVLNLNKIDSVPGVPRT